MAKRKLKMSKETFQGGSAYEASEKGQDYTFAIELEAIEI